MSSLVPKGTYQPCVVELKLSSSRVCVAGELGRVVEDDEERASFGVIGSGIAY